jgi:hypothetical protein
VTHTHWNSPLFSVGHFAIMSSKNPLGDSGAKQSPNPVFGKQSSKDILEVALGLSAKSPYAVARPQPAAARGGSQAECALLICADPAIQLPQCAVSKWMQ